MSDVVNAFTVDVEDWYHICNVDEWLPREAWDAYEHRVHATTEVILRLCDRHRVRATVFVLGYVAERDPALVRRLRDAGHELGTHGYWHRRVFDLTPAEFRADLRRSCDVLGAITGERPIAYRAPEWSIRPDVTWALDILADEGITIDSSTMPLTGYGHRSIPPRPHVLVTPHGPVTEFPATTMRCLWEHLPFAGGLPLRLTPYWYACLAIRRLNAAGMPAMVYTHPWEFDPAPPRVPLPLTRRFLHDFRVRSTPPKIAGLLGRFPFGTLTESLASFGANRPAMATPVAAATLRATDAR